MGNKFNDYSELIVKYGWFEKNNQSIEYHFLHVDSSFEANGNDFNLLIKDTLYQENRMSSYVLEEVENSIYLSFAASHYKIISLTEDESKHSAMMILDLINDKGQIGIRKTYLGFIGKIN